MATRRPPSAKGSMDHVRQRAIVGVRTLFQQNSAEYVVMVSVVLFLVVLGLTMVLSSSFVLSSAQGEGNPMAIGFRQIMWATIAVPGMLLLSRFPKTTWKPLAPTLLLGGLALQALVVFTPLGVASGGNTNWLTLGGLTGQPSEFLKAALIIWMAGVLSTRLDDLDVLPRWLGRLAPGVFLSLALVMLGRDLGTVGVMALVILGILFVAGVRLVHLTIAVGALATLALLSFLVAPYRMQRFAVWASGCTPEDYLSQCWQPMHGIWALGSGGVFGVGLGNSRAKWSWLPEAETDYIFAVIGEELGIIGASIVVVAFLILTVAMVRLVRKNPDPFARLVTAGVLVWIVGQAMVNIAVVLEYLPVLGVPLPFISSGGSALLAGLGAIGVVMSLNRGVLGSERLVAPAPSNRRVVSKQ